LVELAGGLCLIREAKLLALEDRHQEPDAVTRLEVEIDQWARAERFIEMNAEVTSGR
jgi:hypothetical protein